MRGDEVNLRHLRAFVEVCRCGGVSAAAQKVHLSQPAITQAIAKLENGFEAPLFARSSKGMFPTDAGRLLLKRSERAFRLLYDAATRAARKQKGGGSVAYLGQLTNTQLRALVAVGAHGNFSVAARALGVSQPSLYRAARDLEALAEQPLYLKSHKGFELTPAAEALLRAAKLAFVELEQAFDDIVSLSGAAAGRIAIGSLPMARGTILPLALNRLTAERSGLRIAVHDGSYSEMLHSLRHGDIDMLIGALREPVPAPDVQQEPLFADRLGVFCGPTHPLLSASKTPSKAQLARFPWVVARRGTPTREHFDAYFAGIEAEERGEIIESNAPMLVRGLLQGSDRLTMISKTQVGEDVRLGSLSPVPIRMNDKPRMIGVALRSDWAPSPAQFEFLEILRDSARELAG